MGGSRSRPFLQRLRDLQDPWAVEYLQELADWLGLESEPERSRLARELESEDIGTFQSAAFELFLMGYFHLHRCCVTRHPHLQQSVRVPDFLVERGESSFYAEAVVGQDPPEKRAQHRVLNALADALDTVVGPFNVFITPTGLWDDRFSRSRVRRFLEQQLRELEYKQDVLEAPIDYTLDPHLPLRFDVLRAKDTGPVGLVWSLTGDIAVTVTTHETLYDRIDKKVSRYGKLDRPYVVFVRPETEFPAGQFSIERALFGTNRIHLRPADGGRFEFAGQTRDRDGMFSGQSPEGHAIRTRLSAVGIYRHHSDGRTVNRHELAIYHNPWAALPLDSTILGDVPQLVPAQDAGGFATLTWTREPPERASRK